MQLAIWESLYDKDLSITTGSFTATPVNADSMDDDDAVARAQEMLDALAKAEVPKDIDATWVRTFDSSAKSAGTDGVEHQLPQDFLLGKCFVDPTA